MKAILGAICGALLLTACVKPVQVVTPVSQNIVGNSRVVATSVAIDETAQEPMAALEAIAVEKRQEAGLPPANPAVAPGQRPLSETYSTLPFAQMFPLVMEDVTQERGLTSGRDIRLQVTIETIKMANTGMAMLLGSADQLAGNVEVFDAANGEALGEFYVDVVNGHSGLFGMAIRGSGVRESLSEEFALQVSRQLTGDR